MTLLQKLRCGVGFHKEEAIAMEKIGFVCLDPGFSPRHELAKRFKCKCCGKERLKIGYTFGPSIFRYYKEWDPELYPYDETGWPVGDNGERLPVAANPNRTGW